MPRSRGSRRPTPQELEQLTSHIDAHHSACLVYAERMLADPSDAEDAVQDTWLRALRAFDRYDPSRPFRPWLFRILVNTVRSHLKRRRRWWARWTDDVEPDSLNGPAPAEPDDGQLDALRAEVAALPNLLREAFLLKYVSEMSYPEMAAVTGASVSALKMRVKRACELLAPKLEQTRDEH